MQEQKPQMSGQPVSQETLKRFRSIISGRILANGDDDYELSCALWNGMIRRKPALIAQCMSTDDVVKAVRFAREEGLQLSVRGGGHSAAGKALIDDGLVVDLSRMRDVHVDPDARIARAQGGATWAEFDAATHKHELATTGGLISSTGVGGLTLGGGFGWLMRSYGMSCDNLIGAELVTASGDVIEVSEAERPQLLWGLRGGGGNFGVVTRLDFRLHPVTNVLGGMIVHPIERAPEALRFYRQFNETTPRALTVYAAMMTDPDGNRIIAFICCYNGDPDEGREILQPLIEWGPPLVVDLNVMPYPTMQSMLDEGFPPGLPVYWRGDFIHSLTDEVIDTLVEKFGEVTSPLSALVVEQFGGACRDYGPEHSSFGHRDSDYNIAIISRWDDVSDSASHVNWARGVHDAIKPHASGVYVNYVGDGEAEDRVREAYGPEVYDRLARLKAEFDPENIFRSNQNIRPAS
jgi:FAD/FMN-containing dehydrogenase